MKEGGLGLFGTAFVVLFILKVTGLIAWSWWYVTMPLWVIPIIVAVAVIVISIGYLVFNRK